MTKASSLFLLWVALLSLFISITSLAARTSLPSQIFQILFLPVTIYLVYSVISHWFAQTPVFNFPSGWMRLIIYYCFIMTTTLIIASLLAVETAAHLVSSLVFSPLVIYFFWLVRPRRNLAPLLAQTPRVSAHAQPTPKADLDAGRRDFLKLIGTAGISIFFYNLLLRRNPNSFFTTSSDQTGPVAIKNTQGAVINPAEKSPTAGYYISQIDDSAVAYFGFVNNLGQWFIMRQDTDDSYRYVKADKDFAANWTNRAKLTYDYFDNVF